MQEPDEVFIVVAVVEPVAVPGYGDPPLGAGPTLSRGSIDLGCRADGLWIQLIGMNRQDRRIGLSSGARAAAQHYVTCFRTEWVPYPPQGTRKLEARSIKLVVTREIPTTSTSRLKY